MSVRLYVGNLPKELEKEKFESIFAEHSEELVSVKLIADKKTGKCRGFGFVTVKTDEKADQLVEQFNGYAIDDATLKVEKALPRSKGKAEGEGETGSVPRRKGSSSKKASSSSASTGSTSNQPDPRWADELEKLKQMLATQTSST